MTQPPLSAIFLYTGRFRDAGLIARARVRFRGSAIVSMRDARSPASCIPAPNAAHAAATMPAILGEYEDFAMTRRPTSMASFAYFNI